MPLIQCSIGAEAQRASAKIEYIFAGWPPIFLQFLPGAGSTGQDDPYPLLDPVTVLEIVSADAPGGGRGPENRVARMGEQRTDTLRGYTNALIRLANLLTENFLDRDGVRTGLELLQTTYMRGPLDLDGNKIGNMANATEVQDLVTFAQFKVVQFSYEDAQDIADQATLRRDSAIAMGAKLDMGTPSHRLINVGIPTLPDHIVIDAYMDAQVLAFQTNHLPRTGVNPMTNSGGPWSMDNHGINDLGTPTAAGDAVTKLHLDSAAGGTSTGTVPVGALFPHMGGSIPTGFLLCDGREVSRTSFAALFAIIGIAYGTPSGGTTFVLPDLRGRAIIGMDNMGGVVANRVAEVWASTLGGVGGLEAQSIGVFQMASHTHTFTDNYLSSGAGGAQTGETTPVGTASVFATFAGLTDAVGSGNAHNNMQPSMASNWIVRAG